MSSDIKFPVMTRRGIVMCDQAPEGYVMLPSWVESADADHGPHMTRSDVVGILVDLNLVGTEANKPASVDPRPSAEYLAGLIVERDKLQKANDGLRKALEDKDNQRKRAVDMNADYSAKLAAANKELDLWRSLESSRRNQLQVQGLFDPNRKAREAQVPHAGA